MLLTILTPLIIFWMMYLDGVPTLLYHLGRQRELYFSPEIRLLKFERTALVLLLLVYKFVWALSGSFRNTPMQITALITTATLMASFPLLMYFLVRWFTPAWVRQFEADYPDFELAQKQAQVQVMMYPKIFPKVIRHAEGWDTWLLTISREMILGKNFTYYDTYDWKYVRWESWQSWFWAGITTLILMNDSTKIFQAFPETLLAVTFFAPVIFGIIFMLLAFKSANLNAALLAVMFGLYFILGSVGILLDDSGFITVSVLILVVWIFTNGITLFQLPSDYFEKRLILFSTGFLIMEITKIVLVIYADILLFANS